MLRVEAVFMCRGNCKGADRVMASGWFQTSYLGGLLGRYHFFLLFFNGGSCEGWRRWILPLWGARLCKRWLPRRSPGLAPACKSRCFCNCRLQLRDLECVPGSWIRRKSTCQWRIQQTIKLYKHKDKNNNKFPILWNDRSETRIVLKHV